MVIEPASAEDARAVAQIHVEAWRAACAGRLPAEYLDAPSVDQRATRWAACMAAGTPQLIVAREGIAMRGWLCERAIRFYRAAGLVAEPHAPKAFDLAGHILHQARYLCRLEAS